MGQKISKQNTKAPLEIFIYYLLTNVNLSLLHVKRPNFIEKSRRCKFLFTVSNSNCKL
jgi:hypothetical protein